MKVCRGSKVTAPHILPKFTLSVKLRMPNLPKNCAAIGRMMKPGQTKYSG
jgi:hypothetical protein